jgi:hypothetical protein
VEAFFIPKAQKSTPGAEQSQGAAVFFDYRGIVHHSYAPEAQTINKEHYLEATRHLCDAFWHKRPDLWASHNWQLHHDNAPAHSSHLIRVFWPNTAFQLFDRLPTLQTWLLVIL